jgi:DNA-binding NarL/FixJ family response regulator
MMERARLLDGELHIESTPGWGTRIQATLPYQPASQWRPAAAASLPPAPVALPQAQNAFTPASSETLRVVVVDDHAVMRQGLHSMLEATGEITVVGEARDGAEAVTEAVRTRPDVVLMDLQMPGVDGLEGLRRLQETIPELPVVVLTTFHTQESVTDALTAGARGFMLKDAEPAQLVAAIRAAHRGEALLAPAVTNHLAGLASGHSKSNSGSLVDPLNDRELEVLEQLAHGARNKEIAERLFIVPRTVEYHLANIYAKLGVSNRTEAAREAMERGLVTTQK